MAKRKTSSETTEPILPGIVALVRLLALGAAKEAVAHRLNPDRRPSENAPLTNAMEQRIDRLD